MVAVVVVVLVLVVVAAQGVQCAQACVKSSV